MSDKPPFSDRLYAARDRLLASERFQRLSARFPLTRGIANRQTRALFDLCAGFVYSQILFACVRLQIFKHLQARAKTIPELARDLSLSEQATERLVGAAVSIGLLAERAEGKFGLAMLGAVLNANLGITKMVEHHAMLYRDLRDPVALLRGETSDTEIGRYWAYSRDGDSQSLGDADVADYSALMAASQALISQEVLDAYPFQQHKRMLDIGGGEGAFTATAAARFPNLQFTVFDLPAVVARAQLKLAEAGVTRAKCVGGDFFADALPMGADLLTLVRVLHDHDDHKVLALLKAARAALPDDGVLLVAEPMAGVRGAEAVAGYFDFYLLAMGQGRPRTATKLGELLGEAGFGRVRVLKTARPALVSVLVARS